MILRNTLLAAFFIAASCAFGGSIAKMYESFVEPSDDSGVETWWHWTKTFVTKEGITADLESMKEIGISGAHIFVIGDKDYPGNWPDVMSDEWRELFKFAASEAKRLGIKLGIHNCPGWTTAGGPWIAPENAMQMLVSSRTTISGPQKGPIQLEQPETRHGFYRDIAVLAFPSSPKMPQPKISSDFADSPEAFADGVADSFLIVPNKNPDSKGSVVYEFDEPFAAQTLEFVSDNPTIFVNIDISVSDDGVNYKNIKNFKKIGLHEQPGPKTVSFDPVKAKFYKFDFSNAAVPPGQPWWIGPSDLRISEITLNDNAMISDVADKNSSSATFRYWAPTESFAQTQGIKAADILDLTSKLGADGVLNWNAPDGSWTVMRVGYTVTGVKNAPSSLSGLECDKLSRRGLDAHWPNMVGKLLNDDSAIGALKYATIDSYESGGQNWTKGFDAEFKKRRGYSMQSWFPTIFGYVVEDGGQSMRFLYDFQRTVSDLFAENFYDYFAELCRANGLTSITETYGGPFDFLRSARNADIPADEFWINLPELPTRMPSSSAHFNGKKRTGAESFTAQPQPSRWQQDPRELKRWGDVAWSRGITFFILHSFVQQPLVNVKPGFLLNAEGYGSQLNRNNTWWKYGSAWIDYAKRSQHMLQQGAPVADVLILAGESAPNNYALRDNLKRAGYDYDYCCVEDIWDRLDVKDGILVSDAGTKYGMLFLGDDKYLSLKTLRKIDRLLKKGAKIAGLRPVGSPSLVGDEGAYKKLVSRIWDGPSGIISTGNILDALHAAEILPDFEGAENIDFIHRKTESAEIYYIVNTSDAVRDINVSLRDGAGAHPVLWNADTGKTENVGTWNADAFGRITMPISLPPRGSVFVVLQRGEAPHATSVDEIVGQAEQAQIISAVYRAVGSEIGIDATEALKTNPSLKVGNGAFGGDPALGKLKELFVRYKIGDKLYSGVFAEGEDVALGGSAWGVMPNIKAVVENGALGVRFGKRGALKLSMPDGSLKTVEYAALPNPIDISKNWKVEFPENQGVPQEIVMEKPVSWTEYGNGELKYFSGTGVYSKEIELNADAFKEGRRITLDLGEVKNIAQVEVNGKTAATLWKIPFAADITDFLKPGSNTIKIKVANLWVNRLIGDAARSSKEHSWPQWVLEDKPDSGDGVYTFSTHQSWTENDTPPPSGILGEILLRFSDFVKVK